MNEQEFDLVCEMMPPLVEWFQNNARSLKWRDEPTDYHVWISEIMLQQTRVEAVKPYYDRFMQDIPDIPTLADMDIEVLLKYWEGLGYYSRIRNIHKAAQIAKACFDGHLPNDYKELLKLPGIGSYTAGAIASIAFGQCVPAVDGNVLRVMSRMLGDDRDIALPAVKKSLEEDLTKVLALYPDLPGTINQALMELGALVCVPNGQPLCQKDPALCPVSHLCTAYGEQLTKTLPIKGTKTARRVQEMTVFLVQIKDRLLIHKRPEHGLLSGMYEWPNTLEVLSENEIVAYIAKLLCLDQTRIQAKRCKDAKHIFTHMEWHMHPYLIDVESEDAALCISKHTLAKNAGFESAAHTTMEESVLDDYQIVTLEELLTHYPMPTAFSQLNVFLRFDEGDHRL